MSVSAKDWEFIRQYLIDFNGTKAAMRCGQSEAAASTYAFRMLSRAEILNEIQVEQERRAAKAALDANWVLHQWKQIAEADPNDLIYLRVECCRFCYGTKHAYQWTEPEYIEAANGCAYHVCTRKCAPVCRLMIPPTVAGGFGFDPRRPPNPTCPQCNGEGVERVKIEETRKLKGSARRLYAGVKQDKDGRIQVLMRDQDAALNNIAKYLGMVVDKRELSGPNGQPVPIAHYDAKDLTDDQLAAIIMADDEEDS